MHLDRVSTQQKLGGSFPNRRAPSYARLAYELVEGLQAAQPECNACGLPPRGRARLGALPCGNPPPDRDRGRGVV